MRRILVSGASGIVGYGILRSLRRASRPWTLIGTSIYEDSVAQGFCDIFEKAPATGDEAYLDWLLDRIKKHRIDLIVPGIEIDLYKWADNVSSFAGSGAVALLNTPELIQLCRDKWAFYQALTGAGVDLSPSPSPLPSCAIESTLSDDFSALKSRYGLPFLLKPRRGFGSKGIVRVDGPETFAKHQQDIGRLLMVQPIVGSDDEEFTTAAFGDGAGGFFATMTLKRLLSKDGFTDKAEVVATDEFVGTTAALCKHFRPTGPTNFQFRKCVDGIKLLEINPRISSSTSIRAAFGYNESAMAVDLLLEGRVPQQPAVLRGRAVRYIDEHIFYENGIHL
jgi:carbamoyl-phosphate synthase large subunit